VLRLAFSTLLKCCTVVCFFYCKTLLPVKAGVQEPVEVLKGGVPLLVQEPVTKSRLVSSSLMKCWRVVCLFFARPCYLLKARVQEPVVVLKDGVLLLVQEPVTKSRLVSSSLTKCRGCCAYSCAVTCSRLVSRSLLMC